MDKYILNMTKAHAESMIELINHDNQATIGEPLTLAKYNLIKLRPVVDGDQLSEPRTHAVTVQNKKVESDTVEVYYNKISLTDVVNMTSADKDYDWYDPDTWVPESSPALAIAALKKACTRFNVDAEKALGEITVERKHNSATNHFDLVFNFDSYVFKTGAAFQMPKHFSESISVKDLVGFIYEPIKASVEDAE